MTQSSLQLSADVDVSRYAIERKLGEGAAGTVYLAKDLETGEYVALKKLFRMDAKSVLRLKREFRALGDVAHPNIVKLYDMGRAADAWFLTMEYLDGLDLTTYLAQQGSSQPGNDNANALDARRVSALRQLALGIRALHQAGMLHRDLKPSNVLVAGERVVVLDFGLVRELSLNAATVTEDGSVAGTPAYMAPEQLLGKELSAASDWYAFGVIFYEAFSGVLPIEGTLLEMLRRKLEVDPTPLRELAPDVPSVLSDLCMALLHRDEALRPNGNAVIAAFDALGQPAGARPLIEVTDNTLLTEAQNLAAAGSLFGRAPELAQLANALHDAVQGNTVVVHIRGESGAGKSALIEHFLNDIEQPADACAQPAALVLRSRCYELEQMPFKALDAVVDAIVRHLAQLDDVGVAHALPMDVAAVVQVFPVLERLRAVKRLIGASVTREDAVLDRQRAEKALRQLLDRLAMRKSIVVWIDDLQWGDLDSAQILRSWVEQPSDASLLFVFSYRSDEITTSSCLQRLLHVETPAKPRAAEYSIDVAALSGTDIRALCEQRLGSHPQATPELIERIVREAQGSPFLASQLTALAETRLQRGDLDVASMSIDALVAQTGALLPDEANQLLVILAVAGRPMPPKLAFSAAGVRQHGRALVHALRGLNLVRTREVAGVRMLEVYHDRVRERVQASLTVDASDRVHASLLDVLEFSGQADSDWLHTLAMNAGRQDAALEYGMAAAERANASLAFERAAELYETCITLVPRSEAQSITSKWALSLVRCGRGARAAEAYLVAAQSAPAKEAVVLTQRAAAHFLRSGRFEQGEALVGQVLADMQVSIPKSPGGQLAAIAWARMRLKWRGLSFTRRSAAEVPPELLARHDLLEALFTATQGYDPVRAALFQLLAIRCALEAGEPQRVARALGNMAINMAFSGSPAAIVECEKLLERADELARQLTPRDQAIVLVARAISAFMIGRMQETADYGEQALRLLGADAEHDPQGHYHRRFAVSSMRVGALYNLGQVERARVEGVALVAEAHATDNRHLLLSLSLVQTVADLAAGCAAESRSRLDRQITELPSNAFGMLHVLCMVAVMHAACATGEYAWARKHLESAWPRFMRSALRDGAYMSSLVRTVHATMLLNEHHLEGGRGPIPREVRRDIEILERHSSSFAASRLQARVAFFENRREQAIAHLRHRVVDGARLKWLAEAARDAYALAALEAGPDIQDRQAAALQTLRDLGLADPMASIHAYYPELATLKA